VLSNEGGATAPTVAGLLLFGKNPNRFLPQAGIDAVAYPGTEKDYTAKERLSIRGAMVSLSGSQGLVENGTELRQNLKLKMRGLLSSS